MSSMNESQPVPPSQPRRHLRRWLLAGLGLLLAPVLIVGCGVISLLSLNADAAVLRREVAAATHTDWQTRIQLDVGWFTLGTVRSVMRFVQHEHAGDARLALAAVRQASVGVYHCDHPGETARQELLAQTDARMQARGWSRLVGVSKDSEHVLVYVSDDSDAEGRLELCLAVLNGQDLVVVSTRLDGEALARLVESQIPTRELRTKLRLASL